MCGRPVSPVRRVRDPRGAGEGLRRLRHGVDWWCAAGAVRPPSPEMRRRTPHAASRERRKVGCPYIRLSSGGFACGSRRLSVGAICTDRGIHREEPSANRGNPSPTFRGPPLAIAPRPSRNGARERERERTRARNQALARRRARARKKKKQFKKPPSNATAFFYSARSKCGLQCISTLFAVNIFEGAFRIHPRFLNAF